MRKRTRWGQGLRSAGFVPLLLTALAVTGCPWDDPEIEELWTRVDVDSANLVPFQNVPPGPTSVSVRATITYRRIVTGFAVAELRASSTATPTTVPIYPEGDRLAMALAIDSLLQNSVTMGRATRAVTGWDHLMQTIDFNFVGQVPTSIDSTGAAPAGMFLLCYMGSGEEIELGNGMDSLVITPFGSRPYEILPIGMGFNVATPRNP